MTLPCPKQNEFAESLQAKGAGDLPNIRQIKNWCKLGWYEVIFYHRRTKIGPFWQTLQTAVWAAGLIVVLGPLHPDKSIYIPYVVAGLVGWGLISMSLVLSPGIFIGNAALILNIPNSLVLYIIRSISAMMVRTAFQVLAFVPVVVFYHIPINANLLWLVPGLAITAVFLASSMMILGVIGAKYRDLEHVVNTAMRFLFFATPVFWISEQGALRDIVALINPLAWFLDLIRLPLLGNSPTVQTLGLCSGTTILLTLVGFWMQRRFGRYVPTWL